MSNDPQEWSTFRLTEPNKPNRSEKPTLQDTAAADEALQAESTLKDSAVESNSEGGKVDPSFLGMAVSVSRSMAKFAASGFRPADAEVQSKRMAQCHACQYLDGARCKLCGCFADKKAMMPHEDCPIGRWPV